MRPIFSIYCNVSFKQKSRYELLVLGARAKSKNSRKIRKSGFVCIDLFLQCKGALITTVTTSPYMRYHLEYFFSCFSDRQFVSFLPFFYEYNRSCLNKTRRDSTTNVLLVDNMTQQHALLLLVRNSVLIFFAAHEFVLLTRPVYVNT